LEYARVMHAAQSRGLEAILAWWEAAAVHTHTAASALRSLVDKVRESLSGRTSPASASRLLRAACTPLVTVAGLRRARLRRAICARSVRDAQRARMDTPSTRAGL
jgi:hypothetical protein